MSVIIASGLDDSRERQLIIVLKGISPSMVMHIIHLEKDGNTSRESQRHLNPIMQEIVTAEVLERLDVGNIYPISNSKWVSLIQVLPKKSRMRLMS